MFGKCDKCQDYTHPDERLISCISDECTVFEQILQLNGTCATCGDYLHADDAQRICVADPCDNLE